MRLPAYVLSGFATSVLLVAAPAAHSHDGSCVESGNRACISKAERAELEEGMTPRRVRAIVGGQPEDKQKAVPACTCPGEKKLSYRYGRSNADGHVVIVFGEGKEAGTWRLERTDTVD